MKEKTIEQKMYIWRFESDTKLDDTYGIWATNDEDFEEKLEQHFKELDPDEDEDISDIPYWVLTDSNYHPITRNIVLVKEDE